MSEQETSFDVIAIGDTTQDIFLQMADASLQCEQDDENCKICFDYADKIAVEKKTDIAAVGNAANHAIGIARLGLRAAIYTVVGDDVQGHLSQDVFRENNVDSIYVALDQKNGTNFSAVINFKGERTILVYHEPRDYQLPALKKPKWIYLTSASGGGVESLHEQVHAYLEENPDVKMAFNPGTHQIHLGKEKLLPLLKKTSLLFVNREEAAEILHVETSDVKELMQMYHEIGVEQIVITDGPDGAYASDGETILYNGIFEGPVIERTGAGDSFGSGFVAAIIHGKDFTEAMNWGNANSTSVVQYIGAREGLLKKDKLEEMIAANPSVRPSQFETL